MSRRLETSGRPFRSAYEREQHRRFNEGVLSVNFGLGPSHGHSLGLLAEDRDVLSRDLYGGLRAPLRNHTRPEDTMWDLPVSTTSLLQSTGMSSFANASQNVLGTPADTIFTISRDRRRAYTRNVTEAVLKKQKLSSTGDETMTWDPAADVEEDDYEYCDDDLNVLSMFGTEEGPDELHAFEGTGKRKRYTSTDDPMAHFREEIPTYLMETIRREAIHGLLGPPSCTSCGVVLESASATTDTDPTQDYVSSAKELYRCETCGEFLECKHCCLRRHSQTPLHIIKVWTGEFWDRTTLANMGAVYQLGHHGGTCVQPGSLRKLTLIHVNGIHVVHTRQCGCRVAEDLSTVEELLRNGWYPATSTDPATCATFEVLDMFRLLFTVAQVNVRDFVTSLEQMTDPHGTENVPDRYKAFGRMTRQWAFLMRLRRAGVGHLTGGWTTAKEGSVAVPCWACPREGVNIPDGWRNNPAMRFLYRLIVSMDANFRLKERLRLNSRGDPPLYMGLGYQPHLGLYTNHLKNYVKEADVSTCVAFAAMMQRESRLTAGLRVSGVGGCVCARHECVLPQGLGDLQKGERWSNMDYIYWGATKMTGGLDVLLTYDIACQYNKHANERRTKLPLAMRWKPGEGMRVYALPVWHGDVHATICKTRWSLLYLPGAGKTDGEAPERVWSVLNGMANDTKEMDIGNRHDRIEDRCDKHNFQKNVGLGKLLARRLVIARKECATQRKTFDEVSSTLRPELLNDWTTLVDEWGSDRSKPSPFAPSESSGGLSEQSVRADLRNEELEAIQASRAFTKDSSPQSLVIRGIHLEATARSISIEAASELNLSLGKKEKLQERRVALVRQLKSFRRQQLLLMPPAKGLWQAEEDKARVSNTVTLAENITLWLPSAIPQDRREECHEELFAIEERIRRGQLTDALTAIRLKLVTKRYLVKFRNKHLRGQGATTRAKGLLDTVGENIKGHAMKYRAAREALISLVGKEKCAEFRELKDSDLDLTEEAEADAEATRKLGRAGSREARTTAEAIKRQVRNKMSWIWTALGGPDPDAPEMLYEGVRIEFCKALARKTRWEEEVGLLGEEMRRTLVSLDHEDEQWMERAQMMDRTIAEDYNDGRRAYALKQASFARRMKAHFDTMWRKGAAATGTETGEASLADRAL